MSLDENGVAAEQATESAPEAQEAPEAESRQNAAEAGTGDQAAAAEGGEGEKPEEPATRDEKGRYTRPNLPPGWGQGAQRKISQLTAEKYEIARSKQAIETENTLLKQQLAAIRGESSDESSDTAAPSNRPRVTVTPSDEIERRAEQLAVQKAAERAFIEACNAVNETGIKAHPDFAEARDSLSGVFRDELLSKPEFYETITALPNGHEVFYKLGKDLDKASDILSLPRTKMIVELTRMGDEIDRAGKKAPVSKAPPPLRTIDGSGRSPEVDPDKMSTEEWMKWRNKQAVEADRARWSR